MKPNLFESGTYLRLLSIFLDRPGASLYEKEASLEAGVSLGSAHSRLKGLVEEGLLTVERKGKMNFYSLNQKNPAVRHLRLARGLSHPVVQEARELARGHGLRAYIYGPRAMGEMGAFNLLFLGRVEEAVLKQKIRLLEKSSGVKVQAEQFTRQEWESEADPSLRELVERTGVRLA